MIDREDVFTFAWIFGPLLFVILFVAIVVPLGLKAENKKQDAWQENCELNLLGNFKVVDIRKGEIWYCLSDNGRILDME